jgi:hypothetical protein
MAQAKAPGAIRLNNGVLERWAALYHGEEKGCNKIQSIASDGN